ncbi:MAG: alpha/beta hydrolase [Myxococcales bacterium]|nr:alpha/beta hydrolase [Myxococcales bacterium]
MPSPEFSYRQMADDTVALLERLGIREVDVVGWSDGGIIGFLLAIEHPARSGGWSPPAPTSTRKDTRRRSRPK